MTMQELLKLQAEQMKKNTSSLEVSTAANENLITEVGQLSIAVDRAANDDKIKQEEKRHKELNDSLKSLADVIKKNITLAMKQGGGEAEGKGIINAEQRTGEHGSGLRKLMFGEQSRDEIKKGSWMGKIGLGKLSPSMAIEGYVSRKEDKAAKDKFIEGAIKNDKRGIALKNLKGEDYAREDAGKRYDAIKAKEKEVSGHQAAINESQAFGYAGKKKDFEARDKAATELTLMDPRRKKDFVDQGGKPIEQEVTKPKKGSTKQAVKSVAETAEPKKGSTETASTAKVIPIHSEAKEEADMASSKMHAEDLQVETGIGATLIQSLDIQKKQLEAMVKMGEAGAAGGGGDSGGGGILSTAADLAGNVGKKGAGMLGKAGKFLGKHAGKIGAIGGVVMGAMDAYEGWGNANEKEAADNANVDNRVATGEITQKQADELKAINSDKADVSKGGAVGKGVGGAAGAWGGAAAGAAIGSVVPVVGTAIGGLVGGAIGYYGGSAIGEKVGGSLVEGYKGVKNFLGFGGDEKKEGEPTVSKSESNYDLKFNDGKPTINGKPVSVEDYTKIQNAPLESQKALIDKALSKDPTGSGAGSSEFAAKDPRRVDVAPTGSSPTVTNGNTLYGESKANADTAATTNSSSQSNNIVNAPSNVTNNYTPSSTPRVPPRNQDSSLSKYIESKYA
jgi:hypothetical protein